ncbi:MerR family transcriptional regulator [Lentilactobacillus hilgardii]|uniref:MerR family transcriptional regulator n=2 Tax=Lentilactobacillus hilgardii TaxID=1588 RepID=A0A6P1E9B4_LENHI|nr:MerR family transcriptional regulator [Lentilactobacillus hilgardii]EEI70859.1 transcriptional regulator, MerR family [Lentilactobacillus hilgardii ATCC 27305]MCT3390454.1 MerR family transcriptional regulator [Lentilactobacillus hilgardii]QHB52710.1 MerR family transcriptional regulator [Lentilactobacillus hilgardii]RRG09309.1 MAG: MerR family transcriptional regulator [Lactobacillus sp.]
MLRNVITILNCLITKMLINQHWKPLQKFVKRGIEVDKEFQQKLAKILEKNDWHLGIGDVENATGVSQTKLRYWERKGYIKSAQGKGQNRKFTYGTLMKVYQMKMYLDQGYTLAMAAEKAESKSRIMKTLKRAVFDRYEGMETIEGWPAINLGSLVGDPDHVVYAIVKEDNTDLELLPKSKIE